MNMKKNKWAFLIGILCLLMLAVCWRLGELNANPYQLEVFQTGDKGYGYRISEGKRTLIVQPFIPVVSGRKSFKTAEDAKGIGQIVLKRIENGENFSVTREDLEELNVCLSD